MLEAHQHPVNAFVTLTYSDSKMPLLTSIGLQGCTTSEWPMGTLQPKHLQDWLKRLRKEIEPSKIRYYAVGEYGDETERPHYHAALFNFPTCSRGRTRRRPGSTRAIWEGCCAACELVGKTWGHGDVDLGMLEPHSAGYVAGYVTKKMTMRDDPRLLGRHPEFARMSLRPGIGADAMPEVARQLMYFNLHETQPDVPSGLRHGAKVQLMGRYLQKRLRKLVGKDEKCPDAVQAKIKEELRPVQEAAFNASRSFASVLAEVNAPSVAAFKSKSKIFKGKRTL